MPAKVIQLLAEDFSICIGTGTQIQSVGNIVNLPDMILSGELIDFHTKLKATDIDSCKGFYTHSETFSCLALI